MEQTEGIFSLRELFIKCQFPKNIKRNKLKNYSTQNQQKQKKFIIFNHNEK